MRHRQVLQIMNGEYIWPTTHDRRCAATVMYHVGIPRPRREPGVFGAHPECARVALKGHRYGLESSGEFWVVLVESAVTEQHWLDIGIRREPAQLTYEIFLGSADPSRSQPSEIHRDFDRPRHAMSSRYTSIVASTVDSHVSSAARLRPRIESDW